MRRYKEIAIVLVAVIVAAIIYYDHFYGEADNFKKLFPDLKLSEVTSITILDRAPFRLERIGSSWDIVEPIADNADEDKVYLFLDAIANEDYLLIRDLSEEESDKQSEGESLNAENLFSNNRSIVIKSSRNERRLLVSDLETADGKIYIGAGDKIFVADKNLLRWFGVGVKYWRVKRPFAKLGSITKIVLTEREDGPLKEYTGDNLLAVMENLGGLEALDIVDSSEPTFADFTQENPNLEFDMYMLNSEKPIKVKTFYMQNNDCYLFIEGDQKMYLFNKNNIQSIF